MRWHPIVVGYMLCCSYNAGMVAASQNTHHFFHAATASYRVARQLSTDEVFKKGVGGYISARSAVDNKFSEDIYQAREHWKRADYNQLFHDIINIMNPVAVAEKPSQRHQRTP